jgi:hypothetical protein
MQLPRSFLKFDSWAQLLNFLKFDKEGGATGRLENLKQSLKI